jgi:hypothetical protein
MLTREQIELIQREIDGANTPAERAACRSLIEHDAEARALEADLRHLTQLIDQVGEREPSPHLKQAILDALPLPARAASRAESGSLTPRTILRWSVLQLRLATERMEEALMTRKTMLLGGTALAIVLVIVTLVTGFPPGNGGAGTIGGVEQASRYRGRAMTQADVTVKNPEVQALFQNHDILRVVTSDAFREAMQSSAFRELQASEAFRNLMASESYRELLASEAARELMASESFRELMATAAYRELMASEAARELMASAAYRELMTSEAARELMATAAYRELMASEAFRELQASEASRELLASESFRELMASAAFRELMASESSRELMASASFRELMASASFRELMASETYRELMASAAFRELQASAAFRELQATDVFRALSRSQELSSQFMREAMRVTP